MGLTDYRNVKKEYVGSIKFDSKKEARRYQELLLMEKADLIGGIRIHPRYIIFPAFIKNGKKYRKIEYVADFAYYDKQKGREIVEDTKGFETKEFKIKHKMFEYIYKNVELTIIK